MGLNMLSCRPAFKGFGLVSGRPVDLSRSGVGQGLVEVLMVVEGEVVVHPLQVDVLVFERTPDPLDEDVSNARPRPSMLMRIPAASIRRVKSSLVD